VDFVDGTNAAKLLSERNSGMPEELVVEIVSESEHQIRES
jgi:hypothetical protein